MKALDVPLYHGTSTLFLAQIAELGLGGGNPIAQWRVLELAQRIWPLVKEHLSQEDDWILQAQSFEWMCQQRTGNFNFQHGNSYLSPSEYTAVRYAIDKRYGSELLSYTLELLRELVRRKLIDHDDRITFEYSQIFYLLGRSYAPMLVEAVNVPVVNLLDEHGDSPQEHLQRLAEALSEKTDYEHPILQQTNFRLIAPVALSQLTFSLLDFGVGRTGVTKQLVYVPGARNGGLSLASAP